MHVPTIAPVVSGTHPMNHSISPGVKCKYGSISPLVSAMEPSIDMSMPFDTASAVVIMFAQRAAATTERNIVSGEGLG